ncbi:hypothetical protein BC940DRAFT_308476 [Gongronella butleri]|nr:hypothetical protein BC940DRAFT_308476 [Gongronella butleri]
MHCYTRAHTHTRPRKKNHINIDTRTLIHTHTQLQSHMHHVVLLYIAQGNRVAESAAFCFSHKKNARHPAGFGKDGSFRLLLLPSTPITHPQSFSVLLDAP